MDHRLRPAACRSSDSWAIGRLYSRNGNSTFETWDGVVLQKRKNIGQLVELAVVDGISHETVRRTLKKTS